MRTFRPGCDTLERVSFKIVLPPHLLMDRQLIGDRIKHLRESRLDENGQPAPWTQDILAEHAGVHRNTVIRMENSTRGLSIDAYLAVADALGVPMWRLFRDEEWGQPLERDEKEGREEGG